VTPTLAEALPGEKVNGTRPEQTPERHLDGAGVRRRHNADPVIGRHLEHLARQVDRLLQLGFADLCAVGAPERGIA
jgi:hypothetical protein